jgi:hypothetical protein
MSRTGNRSNPNETRKAGHQDQQTSQAHTNASGRPDRGSRGGATHQESRDHNKHNEPGQSGHKPEQHSPAQEKK